MNPNDPSYVASTSVSTTDSIAQFSTFGVDIFSFLGSFFGGLFGGEGVSGGIAATGFLAGLLAVLGVIWSIFTILAYLVSLLFIVLYVYASIRKSMYDDLADQQLRDMERLYDEQVRGVRKNSRLDDVLRHSSSDEPNDWKLAIIEADIILDDTLKKQGYAGNSLGERLKSMSSHQFASLNDAWEAHKVRNRIAHEGSDFVLTKRIAQETIMRYQRVFQELGVL